MNRPNGARRLSVWMIMLSAVLSHLATWPLGHQPAFAQSTNGTYTLLQDAIGSGGTAASHGSAGLAPSSAGLPSSGLAANSTVRVLAGYALTAPARRPAAPAQPTVSYTPSVSSDTERIISGTKSANTSVWINGQHAYAADGGTAWWARVALTEGDNALDIVTTDAQGRTSSAYHLVIVVDARDPVMTVAYPSDGEITNFAELTVRGTVDDHLTQVLVDSVVATNEQGEFVATRVPLAELGPHTLTITATSPLGHTSQQVLTITRGSAPVVNTISPPAGAKGYLQQPLALLADVTDPDGDAISVRWRLDGSLVTTWLSTLTHVWIPQQTGIHQVAAEISDGHGGTPSAGRDVFILHTPISPERAP